jgi:hypothetical protein
MQRWTYSFGFAAFSTVRQKHVRAPPEIALC